MKITEKLNNKRILIWGFGREGKSTKEFIDTYCKVKLVDVFEGKQVDIDESKYDYIIKSPGIVADYLNDKYTSQTELFLEEFSRQTIGITGTKGKSTTSSLLFSVLDNCLDQQVLLVGNIGFPCLSYYGDIDEDSIIVFEMSCHQLSDVKVSPHVAVFLNLFEDHLDYYKTMDRYFKAKTNITIHQNQDDYFYVGDKVPTIDTKANKIVIKTDSPLTFEMNLKGKHNQFNAEVVYLIATDLYKCKDEEVRKVIKRFNGLPHRLEYIGKIDDVDYYDDSISTIPQATIQAISSISNTGTILIGGMDRHIHYGILIDYIKAHQEYNYIFMYESGKRIYEDVKEFDNTYYKEDLKEAVKLAKAITKEGKACVLSPAAASYGYFKNFEERGDTYKKYVTK
ncbi:MAG: UDP-N-acetylmuramoyl-L-alanine--D-glutamate ligase [Thomasclavelia sp.]|nr:UDP-N-acetylmuramoyl-L-alanine--D-glutamate ligase [Thomasclavelia sp.]